MAIALRTYRITSARAAKLITTLGLLVKCSGLLRRPASTRLGHVVLAGATLVGGGAVDYELWTLLYLPTCTRLGGRRIGGRGQELRRRAAAAEAAGCVLGRQWQRKGRAGWSYLPT
ncbi:hypothetical protein F4809DRAFT_624066 [Biscogniauxia mediterranea]|nr:hypothetical protein F4809DRAFT_624066 [Biscogniauxia mediterranea]